MNQKLAELIKFNKALENVYNTLAELEINGQIESEEYQENVDYLDMIKEVIDKKVRALDLDEEEIMEAEEFIAGLNRLDDKDHDIILDVLNLSEENSVRKLVYQLYIISRKSNMFVMTDEQPISDEFDEDEKELIEDELYDEIVKEDELDLLKEDLLSHTLMEYILDAINNEKNTRVKNELIRVKYRLLFLLDTLGNPFIKNQKHFTKVPILQELLVCKYKEEPKLYNEDFLEPIRGVLTDFIDTISAVDKDEIKGYKAKAKYILFKLYLKTFVSIIYDEAFHQEMVNTKDAIKEDAKSDFARENIDDIFKLKLELSNLKKVDL